MFNLSDVRDHLPGVTDTDLTVLSTISTQLRSFSSIVGSLATNVIQSDSLIKGQTNGATDFLVSIDNQIQTLSDITVSLKNTINSYEVPAIRLSPNSEFGFWGRILQFKLTASGRAVSEIVVAAVEDYSEHSPVQDVKLDTNATIISYKPANYNSAIVPASPGSAPYYFFKYGNNNNMYYYGMISPIYTNGLSLLGLPRDPNGSIKLRDTGKVVNIYSFYMRYYFATSASSDPTTGCGLLINLWQVVDPADNSQMWYMNYKSGDYATQAASTIMDPVILSKLFNGDFSNPEEIMPGEWGITSDYDGINTMNFNQFALKASTLATPLFNGSYHDYGTSSISQPPSYNIKDLSRISPSSSSGYELYVDLKSTYANNIAAMETVINDLKNLSYS